LCVKKLLDAGDTVIALANSYGGQVATNALAGLSAESRAARHQKGRAVSHLVYLCAFVLPKNTSMIDKITEMGHTELIRAVYDIEEDITTSEKDPYTEYQPITTQMLPQLLCEKAAVPCFQSGGNRIWI
jgi:hypothetical protein